MNAIRRRKPTRVLSDRTGAAVGGRRGVSARHIRDAVSTCPLSALSLKDSSQDERARRQMHAEGAHAIDGTAATLRSSRAIVGLDPPLSWLPWEPKCGHKLASKLVVGVLSEIFCFPPLVINSISLTASEKKHHHHHRPPLSPWHEVSLPSFVSHRGLLNTPCHANHRLSHEDLHARPLRSTGCGSASPCPRCHAVCGFKQSTAQMLKFAQTPLSSVSLSSFSHSLPYRNKSGAPLAQTGRRILSDAERAGSGSSHRLSRALSAYPYTAFS